MPRVYLETTIPSYLAARPSQDPIKQYRQQVTHHWWNQERPNHYLFASIFVIDEASKGDPTAAQQRLKYLQDIPNLPVTEPIENLTKDLIKLLQIPSKSILDASHLAMTIVHRIDFMLTWNCTHLANPVLQKSLFEYCSYNNLHVPVICTPELLTSPEP